MGCGVVELVNESESTENRPDNSTIVMVPLKGMVGKDCTGTVRVPYGSVLQRLYSNTGNT